MKNISELLKNYKDGKLSEEDIIKQLELDYIEKIDNIAQLDIFRAARTGIPEVIFAESKSSSNLLQIIEKYLDNQDFVLISRISKQQYAAIDDFLSKNNEFAIKKNEIGRIAKIFRRETKADINRKKNVTVKGKVGLISAGTSDIPIAEEAKMVIEAMQCEVITAYDVGIAGFHRIFQPLQSMLESDVDIIIVVAGMEGTLPGVVSALVKIPVIGVPTSTGYGLGGDGTGALTTMLQSCSPGLTIVNIDNGFGAGASAALHAIHANRKRK